MDRPVITTFPEFCIRLDNMPVKLRAKSRELLAYLVNAQGRDVSSDELLLNVLKRKRDEKSLVYLRVQWHYLREELKDYGIENIIGSCRGGRYRYAVPACYDCDLDELTEGQKLMAAKFVRSYLNAYGWADEKRDQLTQLAEYYRKAA